MDPTQERTQGPPDVVYRDFTLCLDRSADGEAKREYGADDLIPIALSSEHPVERFDWWEGERYLEVLDHSPEAVDLSYARDGMPFLLDHTTRELHGLIENLRVDSDRVLRGEVRFSRAARSQEIRQDMIDGIRKKISVGYRLDQNNVEKKQGEGDKLPTWRFKRWTPMEGSSVAIPADYSVGVGRAAGGAAPAGVTPATAARAAKETTVENETAAAQPGAATRTSVGADRAEQERTRALAELAKAHGRTADLPEWITTGRSVDQVKDELLTAARSGVKPIDSTGAADVRLTPKEERDYSIVRGIQSLLNGGRSGFEFEVSQEIERQLNRDTQGFFVPTSIRAQNPSMAPDTRKAPETRTQLSVGGAGKGAEATFSEYGGFIDLLRNRAAVLQLGAQLLPGLKGDVAFVGQSGAGVAGWNAEAVNQALSSLSLALRSMAPKNLQSATSYTRQLLQQAVFSVENLVRNDIAQLHALEIDRAAIAGTGTSGQPRGIINTTGVGSVVGGTNGAQPTYDHIIDLETEVAIDNADIGTLGYLAHSRIRGRLKKTAEMGNTAALPVWRDGEMNGYQAVASNQVPSNQTKGTSTDCSPIIFGAFGELLIGEWGAMEVLVDPFTLGPSVVKVMSIQLIDVFLRYVEAFAQMPDARP